MATIKKCPRGPGEMKIENLEKNTHFKGVDISYQSEVYVCPECGLEAGTVAQAAEIQKVISDAYRKEVGLLTGEEIRKYREDFGLTQQALANEMTVGIASIKRWEAGAIQSRSMDNALRSVFWNRQRKNDYTGNRQFSISRIKLILKKLEELLGKKLLLKGDKMLFAAKYLWYADMLAFRELKKSMTGATYTALPYGPQLNNYKDLIDVIKKSDETTAEPLTYHERSILQRIASKFPQERMVYDASHKESIWKDKKSGEIILYSESFELTEL